MTNGVGGSTIERELGRMRSMRESIAPIDRQEYLQRIAQAQSIMRESGLCALYLDASTSTFYFTGISLKGSDRLSGAIIPAEGEIVYVTPALGESKLRTIISPPGEVRTWHEHESPTELVIDIICRMGHEQGTIAIDPATPFFIFDGLRRAGERYDFANGALVTARCRMIKSAAEIALIKCIMELTLEVHTATARILREGMTTREVADFVDRAFIRLGADGPAAFKIVEFGEPTAYPDGVSYPQTLKRGDMVLVDLGASLHGYRSDLTRSYVFGTPSLRQREVWCVAKRAAEAAFAAARLGATCESLDRAAREVIEAAGFCRDYRLPGLPHRTGHGIGLDLHEEPYFVTGDKTALAAGMCFSDEPAIYIPGEFGIRLEDHIHMTEQGPEWLTAPSASIDDPFGKYAR